MSSSWVHFLNHMGHLSMRCSFSHVSFLLFQVACNDHPFLFGQEFRDGNKVCRAVRDIFCCIFDSVGRIQHCRVLCQTSVSLMGGGLVSKHQYAQIQWRGGQDSCWSLWTSVAWAEKWWSMALGHCVSLCSPKMQVKWGHPLCRWLCAIWSLETQVQILQIDPFCSCSVRRGLSVGIFVVVVVGRGVSCW